MTAQAQVDFFICHAFEDKGTVAWPIYNELINRGHSVWLDEAVLTLGDSLRQIIDKGLSECRFGVVVFSPSFFDKQWTQYELDGLLDRQMAGTKTVLPVWHEVTHDDVAAKAPSLAGRYAVSTSNGVTRVVDEIVRAYEQACVPATIAESPQIPTSRSPSSEPLQFPLSEELRSQVLAGTIDDWEFILFADALIRGMRAHELAWRDHQLGLVRPGGRQLSKDEILGYTQRAFHDLSSLMENLTRLFTPQSQVAAFGAAGSPGDAAAIEHLCKRAMGVYGQFLEWAAEVRSTRVPSDFSRLFELLLSFADEPIAKSRDFVGRAAHVMARLSELPEGTNEEPYVIHLEFRLAGEDSKVRDYQRELKRLKRRRKF